MQWRADSQGSVRPELIEPFGLSLSKALPSIGPREGGFDKLSPNGVKGTMLAPHSLGPL
jgi:hypothetical protein